MIKYVILSLSITAGVLFVSGGSRVQPGPNEARRRIMRLVLIALVAAVIGAIGSFIIGPI